MEYNRNLRRKEASAYLRDKYGIQHSPAYLAKLACVGGGPAFRKVRRTPMYDRESLDAYAAEITSPLIRSTSELRAGLAGVRDAQRLPHEGMRLAGKRSEQSE
jgi:hypothetical protein